MSDVEFGVESWQGRSSCNVDHCKDGATNRDERVEGRGRKRNGFRGDGEMETIFWIFFFGGGSMM